MKLCAFISIAASIFLASGASASGGDPANLSKSETIYAWGEQAGFSGEIAVSVPGLGFYHPHGDKAKMPSHLWRWASVTKQVIAVLVMQEVAKGHVDLDAPVSRYLPGFKSPNATKVSVRQLLRHQSGLPNPDDVQASSMPVSAFYFPFYKGSRDPLTGYCAGTPKGEPGGQWEYNNCDYMVAGALLEAVTGKSWQQLVASRIAKPLHLTTLKAFPASVATNPGFDNERPEPPFDFASFGASAGLYGSTADLIRFDNALMNGRLLKKPQLDEMWDGQNDLGFIALGQWVFSAPLKGCAEPVKIVERRGAIGGVELRNFILPDKKAAIVAVSNEGGFGFGEVWQGSGFSHDLLSKAVCE